MAKNKTDDLIPFNFSLTGRCIKSLDQMKLEFVSEDQASVVSDNFSSLKNIKYTDNGVTGVTGGMSKINTTAITSHPKIQTMYQFKKVQPAETHVLVQSENAGETESKIFQNTTAIPSQGDFSGTALHTDASGSGIGRFSDAPDEHVAYCNSSETLVWGGDETRVSNFTIFDPNGTFLYDYTEQVQNTLSDSNNVATLKQVSGIGSETKLLLHCDGSDASTTITDSSPISPHTVTAVANSQLDTAKKKFGTAGLLGDGTGDWNTIPTDSDFNLAGGVWTYEQWLRAASLSADIGLYSQAVSTRTGDYIWMYVDTDGAVNLKIQEGTTAATGTVTLDSGAAGSVDGITVNSVQVMSGAESFDTDLNTTATAVAANITAHTSSPNYTAAAVGATITITSAIKGDHVNSYVVASSVTTIASTDVNMASGANTTVLSLATPNSTITTSASVFTHIRIVENANDYYIFVNGVQKAFTTSTVRPANNSAYNSLVYIGATHNGTVTTKSYNGTFDEVRLTNSALSTSNFDVPVSAYTAATADVNMRVGNTMPVDGFKFTVSNANTSTGTMAVFYWSSTGAWTAVTNLTDNTSAGGIPLAQSGTVTFDSTANIAKQKMIDGILGFWFRIEIDDADTATAISNVTISEPFQAIQDFWDGEFRTAFSVQLLEDSINKDNTINVFEDSFTFDATTQGNVSTYMIMDDLLASTEYLQIGFLERQQGIRTKFIPDHGNSSTAAVGSVKFTGGLEGTVDGITVNSVEIMNGAEPFITDLITTAEEVAKSINAKTSSPNYVATSSGTIVTITAVTKGASVNGFVVSPSTSPGDEEDVADIAATGVNMANGVTSSATLTVSYWNGTTWTSVGTIDDGTISDNVSFGKTGYITWTAIPENTEFKREISEDGPLYYYKLEWSEKFSPDALCYFIAGIPVQKPIAGYKFPLMAQGRLWLFSNQSSDKNEVIVSNVNELNSFNGEGSGEPLKFGDKTEITAAVELFSRTTTTIESNILVLKEHSTHIVEGVDPDTYFIVNLTNNIGCNAPYTLAISTIGLEVSPLQRKQVAIWQGSGGIYMFDGTAIHPISDDIENFFDKKHSNSINLSKANLSYGFFEMENGEHYYHWCFASGSSTTLNNEWVLDLKRQKWFEVDRGSGKAIQGGGMVIDTTGNIYNYGFEDNGFLQYLNNGTDYDGNAIDYEMELGDLLPNGDMSILTSVDSLRMATVSKTTTTSTIKAEHFGDCNNTATTPQNSNNAFYTFQTKLTGSRVAYPFQRINTPRHISHRFKFTISTNNESGTGFEPLYVGGFFKNRGISEKNLTD